MNNDSKRLTANPTRHSSIRTIDDWIFLIRYNYNDNVCVLDDKNFPFSELNLDQWKELIQSIPKALSCHPPVEKLLNIMKRQDFVHWNGAKICQALLWGGKWLVEGNLISLEKIKQRDFDMFFGKDKYPTPEEFWNVVPGYFPNGFPPHIHLPFPYRPDNSNDTMH